MNKYNNFLSNLNKKSLIYNIFLKTNNVFLELSKKGKLKFISKIKLKKYFY